MNDNNSNQTKRTKTLPNVISLTSLREIRKAKDSDPVYETRIARMEKLELLEEMIRFQEERSRMGQLTLTLMIKGRILFQALESHAETQELKLLSSSYRRHLELEMQDFMKRRGERSKIPNEYEKNKLKN